MIHSKNRSGFTLIEVMFAVAIVGIILIPLMATQSALFERIIRTSRTSVRTFMMGFFLQESATKIVSNEKLPPEKKIDDPITTLSITTKSLEKEKAFKRFHNIERVQVTGKWEDNNRKVQDNIVTFLYKPEKSEKK